MAKKTEFDESKLSAKERRQYQRLYFDFQQGRLRQILGAEVIWPDDSCAEVYDMSYSGAALRLPKKLRVKRGEFYRLKIALGQNLPIEVEAEIIWVREHIAGIRWAIMPPEVHSSFAKFLVDKLVGANLTPIHPQFFSESMTFDYWFHGPKDTNLYLWMERSERGEKTNRVDRAVVELDDQTLVYEYGSLSCGQRSPDWEVQRDYGDAEEWLDNWEAIGQNDVIVQRTLSLLSQVPEMKAPLRSLMMELDERGEGGA
ncbi:MAG: PilZ domain-containing protein [Bdellovibrionaceae bacterium]|nr:PilZ domain-containing protein [Bdellovibrionales bacterium]MCB9083942.1 PilZ domain-containing protein [Pseudobdellovibrionaceae bacterium]